MNGDFLPCSGWLGVDLFFELRSVIKGTHQVDIVQALDRNCLGTCMNNSASKLVLLLISFGKIELWCRGSEEDQQEAVSRETETVCCKSFQLLSKERHLTSSDCRGVRFGLRWRLKGFQSNSLSSMLILRDFKNLTS
jgi:hypothetical protein